MHFSVTGQINILQHIYVIPGFFNHEDCKFQGVFLGIYSDGAVQDFVHYLLKVPVNLS
jgi:hypothetical protein